MRQLVILAFVFVTSACLASVTWGQHFYYQGPNYTWDYYQGGSQSNVAFSFGNGPAYRGYGYQPYPMPRVSYYQNYGYPVRYGYQRPIYSAPGCDYGYRRTGYYFGSGVYYGW
ncbi:MAG: hypothetical protein ACKO81_13910 [Planctomycetota bacterium]